MSSHTVISEVSNLLRTILQQGLGKQDVDLNNPGDDAAERTLSIWLYQVTPNEHLRNANNIRATGEVVEHITPLPLDLYYLLTPSMANESTNQVTLGRALQVLYDNSIITLNAGANTEELHLSICQRSIEELAKVWEALHTPYRLSVCFEVRVVRIDSERTLQAGRILERATDFEEMPVEDAA